MSPTPFYSFDFDGSEFIDVDVKASGITASVVPILYRYSDGRLANRGTGFCILGTAHKETVLATARHVVADLEHSRDIDPMILLPNANDENNLLGVRINQISLADTYSDVSLVVADLTTAMGEVKEPKRMPLTFGEPAVGQKCMALGYGRPPDQVTGEHEVKYFLSASRGTINQIHNPMRDRSLSTFPTFETSALYPPGMSGGPIIDIGGNVVGIVSHGFDGAAIGYGACSGALIEMKIDLTADDGVRREFSVKELAETGLIGIPKIGIQLNRTDQGVRLDWSF